MGSIRLGCFVHGLIRPRDAGRMLLGPGAPTLGPGRLPLRCDELRCEVLLRGRLPDVALRGRAVRLAAREDGPTFTTDEDGPVRIYVLEVGPALSDVVGTALARRDGRRGREG